MWKLRSNCMKKIYLSFIMLSVLTLCAQAGDVNSIPYKNLKNKSRITYNAELDSWSTKIDKKSGNYFTKISVNGISSEFINPDESLAFSTNCSYEFLKGKDFIGYPGSDLKFYDFAYTEGELTKRELTEDEVQALFPDFRIIKISEFSPNTNSLKIKKHGINEKIIILNDTEKTFDNYTFTSGNAKFNTYPLAGFIEVTKKGMIQFSHFGENTEITPWFILLLR